jgi:hypothetical protein
MSLGWRARRRWALVILLVGMPLYVVAAVTLMARFHRPPLLIELAVYMLLGVIWALPFRAVFRGVGRPDGDAGEEEGRRGE